MQRLEVSGAVRLVYRSLGVKGLITSYSFNQMHFYISKKKAGVTLSSEHFFVKVTFIIQGA